VGGIGELLSASSLERVLFRPTALELAKRIHRILASSSFLQQLTTRTALRLDPAAVAREVIHATWDLATHPSLNRYPPLSSTTERLAPLIASSANDSPDSEPRRPQASNVAVCVTHFNRHDQIMDAPLSLAYQTVLPATVIVLMMAVRRRRISACRRS
jgi:hypothetical protein